MSCAPPTLVKIQYLPACEAEQEGAIVLGYTEVSWDDLSGKTRQPWIASKSWRAFTDNEKIAAGLLGYNQTTWDNDSGSEPQPASAYKFWADLTTCTDSKDMFAHDVYLYSCCLHSSLRSMLKSGTMRRNVHPMTYVFSDCVRNSNN